MAEKRYEMDMCSGPLLSKILAFTLPLILSSMLQLLFNAADVIVVGRYAGSTALAAVGSTGALINLIVNLFMGLSVGVSVTVARHYGAREYADVTTAVHTAILMSLIGGIAAGAFGFFMAKPLLALMGSPADVIDQAALYVRIYFIGMPASMFYNFGSAVLRAVGDTKRPLLSQRSGRAQRAAEPAFRHPVFHGGSRRGACNLHFAIPFRRAYRHLPDALGKLLPAALG